MRDDNRDLCHAVLTYMACVAILALITVAVLWVEVALSADFVLDVSVNRARTDVTCQRCDDGLGTLAAVFAGIEHRGLYIGYTHQSDPTTRDVPLDMLGIGYRFRYGLGR